MNAPATQNAHQVAPASIGEELSRKPALFAAVLLALLAFIAAAFWHSFTDIYNNWNMPDSLYSHAMIIPPISLFFVWRSRKLLLGEPLAPSMFLGLPVVLFGCFMLLLGDFLGFMTFVHLALLPVLTGLCLMLLGVGATRILWFPLAFLFFMIPMPYSLLSVISFKSKMIATESAVALGKLMTLNMVQDGSFVYLGSDDRLLVGDVCGGMRSLIALLAFGALMAYISKTRVWARILILVVSPLVAILANVVRIFFLCVVGYIWGSESATGIVHDASGIGIFAVAFVLLFSIEGLLRRLAPLREDGQATTPVPETQTMEKQLATRSTTALRGTAGLMAVYLLGVSIVGASAGAHWAINIKRDRAAIADERYPNLDLPPVIGSYYKVGEDIDPGDDVRRALETSSILMRYYVGGNGLPILTTIVYAGQKRRSLHFPEVCLVGQGWEVEQAYSAPVGIEFQGKRLVIFRGDDKQAVLYWLKTGDLFTSSTFINALFWAREQLLFGTPTSSMIKLSMPIRPGQDEDDAFAVLDDFATRLGPILLENIQ